MTTEDRAWEALEKRINTSKNGDIVELDVKAMERYIEEQEKKLAESRLQEAELTWEEVTTKDKPKQYAKGIDTIERAKSRLSAEALLAVCVFQVDKYIWRDKGTDLEDFKKARDYIDLAIETMEG